MAYSFRSIPFFCSMFLIINLSSLHQSALAWSWGTKLPPTLGLFSLPFNRSYYHIQKPYNVPEEQRYCLVKGVHKCWVYSTDKPHTTTSRTRPRTEIAVQGYNYSSGVWEFEAYGYVPKGTSGVCIMQVFGANAHSHATTLMLRVYNGSLTYYRAPVLVKNIYNKWFKLNVVHDVDAAKVRVSSMDISKSKQMAVEEPLMLSNVVSMPRIMSLVTWSLVGNTLKFGGSINVNGWLGWGHPYFGSNFSSIHKLIGFILINHFDIHHPKSLFRTN